MKNIVRQIFKFLTFRSTKEDIIGFDKIFFYVGLGGTWLVGMGRYWDNPKANLLQHLGLGSVVYIFLMAGLIFIVFYPFKLRNWSYKSVLTFVSITSFPAILYAIPVEKFTTIEIAASLNAKFLMIVAAWRLALLFYYLFKVTDLDAVSIIVGSLLPVCAIIVILTALNLERAVFNIMGGFQETTAHDKAYQVLVTLTLVSFVLIIPLLLGYISCILFRGRNPKRSNN